MSEELRNAQQRLSDQSVRDYWLSVDTCIDAMPRDEFDSLAAIALTELPLDIRDRFATKDLRTIKSIRGRVFELYRTEQPA